MARGFEHVDHTADLAIHAWGATLGEAFEEAARGLFAYMTEMETARPVGAFRFVLAETTPERLLHAWLETLLFHHQRDLLVFSRFRCDVAPDGLSLEGVAEGEAYAAERHGPIHEVKAVTYHDMRIVASPPRVEVVVDI
ncbi:MAG TPA: archease [Candidatus Thermoplasmatota archaeon]|nr:archease [Candidatus Thermoplasmatota archaeon]